MRAFLKLFVLLSAAVSASATLVFHDARSAAPSGFVRQGTAPATQLLELRIGLASNNIDGLREKLMSVSTPGNAEFRQWLSAGRLQYWIACMPNITDALTFRGSRVIHAAVRCNGFCV